MSQAAGGKTRIVVITGATASGKSGLALAAAEAFGGVVINADALQVYRDLRILSARPSLKDEDRVPHALYGVLDAAEVCSAERWRRMALDAVAVADASGRLPIVVGGTGLYLRALLAGLSPLPQVPVAVREEARGLHATLGDAAFHARLAGLDPEMAARISPDDGQRMLRAWEVLAATGRSLAEWQAAAPEPSPVEAVTIALDSPPHWLNPRIDRRLWAMVEEGALDEVRALDARGLDPALPAMKAVGVPEFRRYLKNEVSLAAAVAGAQAATRRYAKRQRTWLRHQTPKDASRLHRLEAQFSERLTSCCFKIIRNFLLTT